MSINKVEFTRGIKGKRGENDVTDVKFNAVGKVDIEKVRTKLAKNTATLQDARKRGLTISEPDENGSVTIDTPVLIEDGIVTDVNEAMSLMNEVASKDVTAEQNACNALVRHYNYLKYREAVEKVVGIDVPDELDEILEGVLEGEAKASFKRTVTMQTKMLEQAGVKTSRLLEAQNLLNRLTAAK